MKLPISKRLLKCAELVPPCETVADVGTDHGYLAIHLLQAGTCRIGERFCTRGQCCIQMQG